VKNRRLEPVGLNLIAYRCGLPVERWLANGAELDELLDFSSLVSRVRSLRRGREKLSRIESCMAGDIIETELERCRSLGVRFLTRDHDHYPEHLRAIDNSPFFLYYRGRSERLVAPAVAIVGSRRATSYGKQVAYDMASGVAAAGVSVVSGLARGIDTAAHEGALTVSFGTTVAVLGCGIDRVYPPENAELLETIASNGVVVSEFPLGTAPHAANFPRRNRIIAGLCLATVVVEADERSGSLITARMAAEQGRDVFAVPGDVRRPVSLGPHRLLKAGAGVVCNSQDVLEHLGIEPVAEVGASESPSGLSENAQSVWRYLLEGDSTLDDLLEHGAMGYGALNRALFELIRRGVVRRGPAGSYVPLKRVV